MARPDTFDDGARTSLLERGSHDDPSLIILRANQRRQSQVQPTAQAGDPREHALLRAGFNSAAGNRFLQAMGAVRQATFDDHALTDGEAEARFSREADAARKASLDVAVRDFPDVEPEARATTDRGLAAMTAAIHARGMEARKVRRGVAALDALEAEADDLIAQVRRDPDRHEDYAVLTRRALEPFEEALPQDERSAFADNVRREIAAARVLRSMLPAEYEAMAAELKATLAKLPETGPITYYRVANLNDAFVKGIIESRKFSDPGFMSASLLKERALKYPGNTYIEIEGHSGRFISPLAHNPNDMEALFQPDTEFQLVGFVAGGGPNGLDLIQLREIKR